MKNLTRRLTRDNGTYGCSCRPHAVVQRVRPLRIKARTRCVVKVQASMKDNRHDAASETLAGAALRRIGRYCERFPQGSDEAIDCWTAHNYLTSEALTAEQQCDLESPDGSTTGKACADFQRWENFVQQVESAGGAEEMVQTILAEKNAKAKKSTSPGTTSRRKSSIVPAREFSDETKTRRFCKKLFAMKDANGDGRINVEEFRSLMKAIGDEVSGDTVAMMFDSMDIHNSLDFDEFIAILEAESIRSRSQTAGMLRSVQRHGHYGDRPKWLDNI